MNVVITGTTSGLGEQLRNVFFDHGHHVIGSKLEFNHGDEFPLDLRDSRSIEVYADEVVKQMGVIDVLINNAGINAIRHFQDLDEDFLHLIMQVNCFGPVMLTKHLLPMIHHGQGRVINIISDAAWRPMRQSLAYNISKSAFDMATKQMARELTKTTGISFIGIRPGRMSDTQMSHYIDEQVMKMRGWTLEQTSEYYRANSLTGEEAPPRAVARMIYEIATGDLAHCMSGACLDLVG